MKVERFDTDGIDIGERLRPLSQARVAALVSSIREIGLRTPLTVIVRPVGDETRVVLVTGHHRLSALRELGEDRVDCFVIDDDEIDAKLWEIDENLMRASLSPTEEAEHLKLRKELWAARLAAESGNTVPTLTGRGNKGFASDTAEKVGITKRSLNEKIARAEAISAEAMSLVKGSRLDKGIYLDELKSLSHEQQVSKVRSDLAAPPALRPRSAEPVSNVDMLELQVAALMAAWNKASPEARAQFVARVDIWSMDQRAA